MTRKIFALLTLLLMVGFVVPAGAHSAEDDAGAPAATSDAGDTEDAEGENEDTSGSDASDGEGEGENESDAEDTADSATDSEAEGESESDAEDTTGGDADSDEEGEGESDAEDTAGGDKESDEDGKGDDDNEDTADSNKDSDKEDKSDDAEDTAKGESDDDDKQKGEHEDTVAQTSLTIGSKAPSLDIEHWIQDGNGKFKAVKNFEKGKVYVVEFWATWCGPCISSMPHIVEMQTKYASSGVQFISVSDEDLETVERFLKRKVRGSEDEEEPKTYLELTSAYSLTTDPDRSTSKDYMRAANQNGIPCAFVVGKKGHIEWIGHPMSMDDALDQVVNDKWDRKAFQTEYIAKQKADAVLSKLSRLMRAKETDQAIELLDGYIAGGELESARNRFKQIKFQVLASDDEFADSAADYAVELLKDDSHNASSANNLAWSIYMMAKTERFEDDAVTKEAIKLARSKVEEADDIKPYLLDTVAHLQHTLGNSKQALKTQRRAMKVATPEQKARLEGFLKELTEIVEPKPKEDAKDTDAKESDVEQAAKKAVQQAKEAAKEKIQAAADSAKSE